MYQRKFPVRIKFIPVSKTSGRTSKKMHTWRWRVNQLVRLREKARDENRVTRERKKNAFGARYFLDAYPRDISRKLLRL